MEESVAPQAAVPDEESDEYWQDHLEKFSRFRGSSREYCKQNGLKYGRFYRFKRKLGFIKVRKPYQKAFVQIKPAEELTEKDKPVILRPRGSNLPDPKWMAEFVKELLRHES